MQEKLKGFNTWIDKEIRTQSGEAQTIEVQAIYKGGIIIPFGQRDIEDPLVILSCVPVLSIIFETKVRAPFKVVFEVCKLSEVIQAVRSSQNIRNEENKQREGTMSSTSISEYNEDLSAWRVTQPDLG
jgi:hypothetical protein